MNGTQPQRRAASRSRVTRTGDRLLAATVSGPPGRGISFCIELAAAIRRGLRGERQDPEERRY